MDKTGTLTKGRPEVTDVISTGDMPKDELLQLAASAEHMSEHPLAQAVVRAAETAKMPLTKVTSLQSETGKGVVVEIGGNTVRVGSRKLMAESGIDLPESVTHRAADLEREGNTVIFVASGVQLNGMIALADILKPEAREALDQLHALGIEKVMMLTGDSRHVAQAVADELGIDDVRAELMPGSKEGIIRELAALGPVAMVGDGVNDAPALASGNLGVAMGAAGSDVALETADVVLMSDDLLKLPWMIKLSRRARRVVWQNIIFAMSVIVVLVASVFIVDLPLPLGVVGHEGSTLLVVANGLRLLRGSD
jgi:Cd2+/Zn2+-exporting ATPase